MLVYILKSAACLVILLLFYKFFLENERMHTFKRFYLLGSLILSLVIPLLTFVEYATVPSPEEIRILGAFETQEAASTQNTHVLPFNLTTIIWPIYWLGMIVFGLRFVHNLVQLLQRIRKNPKHRQERCTHVHIHEKLPPHTFLKFIFLNKQKLENNEIPKEVLVHEETHVIQKHSWDVIFIELLQVAFWFNPLMVLFKKAIKLNHEFLADQAVLSKDVDAFTYQNTLLVFSTSDQNKQFQPALLNAINYSSIKKRLIVMKTETSQKSMLIRSLVLLPLVSLLLYSFSTKKVVEKTDPIQSDIEGAWLSPEEVQQSATRKQMAEYEKLAKYYNDMPKNHMKIKSQDVDRLTYIYSIMSEKQRNDAEPFPDFPEPPTPPKAPMGEEVGESLPPPPPPNAEIMEVPAPPTPADHVKKMAKLGAVFYYEGKQIDAEKAIHLVTTNHSLNIDSRNDSKSGKPMVKISKDPIIIKR
ncbi:M56 family metallopeptidase [Flagellimonas sp. W118]|uniref:M56 family metallopeptidase n=1 Tax=Flagellimonas sp. W118 TaxID=3410791 RepID=UPI003BF53DFF